MPLRVYFVYFWFLFGSGMSICVGNDSFSFFIRLLISKSLYIVLINEIRVILRIVIVKRIMNNYSIIIWLLLVIIQMFLIIIILLTLFYAIVFQPIHKYSCMYYYLYINILLVSVA